MYFVEQYKRQFQSLCVNYVDPEGRETGLDEVPKTPDPALLDPTKLAERAERLSFGIDAKLQNTGPRIDNLNSTTPENMSAGTPDSLGNIHTPNEFSLGERVLTPEEQKVISGLEDKTLTLESPEVVALAEEMGMEEVLRTAGIDGITQGEVLDIGIENSSPEQIQGSIDEITTEQQSIESQIASFPVGSPERVQAEQRLGLLAGFVTALNRAMNGEPLGGTSGGLGGGTPQFGPDVVGDGNVINKGETYLNGHHEKTGKADKFLFDYKTGEAIAPGKTSARETPWCAGFVSYVLNESGYNVKSTLSSKAFIGETGKGHVAFYAGGGQMLGGNQSDQVSIAPIKKEIKGFISPQDLAAGKPPQKEGSPKIGDVIVFDRGGGDRNMA